MKTNRIISTPYEGKFTKVEIHEIESSSGEKFPWEVVIKKPVVAALVENITNKTFILVEQYRPPVQNRVIELVAGICDKPGFSKEDIIRAEILEETGYTTEQIELIIKNTPKSAGGTSEIENKYYAQVNGSAGKQNLQDNEEITVLEVEKKDLEKFLKSKEKEGIYVSDGISAIIGRLYMQGGNILN